MTTHFEKKKIHEYWNKFNSISYLIYGSQIELDGILKNYLFNINSI